MFICSSADELKAVSMIYEVLRGFNMNAIKDPNLHIAYAQGVAAAFYEDINLYTQHRAKITEYEAAYFEAWHLMVDHRAIPLAEMRTNLNNLESLQRDPVRMLSYDADKVHSVIIILKRQIAAHQRQVCF